MYHVRDDRSIDLAPVTSHYHVVAPQCGIVSPCAHTMAMTMVCVRACAYVGDERAVGCGVLWCVVLRPDGPVSLT